MIDGCKKRIRSARAQIAYVRTHKYHTDASTDITRASTQISHGRLYVRAYKYRTCARTKQHARTNINLCARKNIIRTRAQMVYVRAHKCYTCARTNVICARDQMLCVRAIKYHKCVRMINIICACAQISYVRTYKY